MDGMNGEKNILPVFVHSSLGASIDLCDFFLFCIFFLSFASTRSDLMHFDIGVLAVEELLKS